MNQIDRLAPVVADLGANRRRGSPAVQVQCQGASPPRSRYSSEGTAGKQDDGNATCTNGGTRPTLHAPGPSHFVLPGEAIRHPFTELP